MGNPFIRLGESAQKTGRRFESFWAGRLGVKPQKGSGNLWYAPMDVGDGSLLWSLKYSAADTLRFGKLHMGNLMREVEEHINGPGGTGGDIIPAVATAEGEEIFVTLRAEDFLRIVQSDSVAYVPPSKGEMKRSRAGVPALLREDQ